MIPRAKEAFENGYFFERCWISYTLIDDRVTSTVNHLGEDPYDDNNRTKPFNQRLKIIKKEVSANPRGKLVALGIDKVILGEIAKWSKKRNDFVHELTEQGWNYVDYEAELEQLAIEGMELFGRYANGVMRLKKRMKSSESLPKK